MKLLPAFGTGLNYLERVKGIEPSLFAWEAKVLPLNDTRDVMKLWPNISPAFTVQAHQFHHTSRHVADAGIHVGFGELLVDHGVFASHYFDA